MPAPGFCMKWDFPGHWPFRLQDSNSHWSLLGPLESCKSQGPAAWWHQARNTCRGITASSSTEGHFSIYNNHKPLGREQMCTGSSLPLAGPQAGVRAQQLRWVEQGFQTLPAQSARDQPAQGSLWSLTTPLLPSPCLLESWMSPALEARLRLALLDNAFT